jgi:dTDP-4-amino-4,6-dideoxygalactose transaminase
MQWKVKFIDLYTQNYRLKKSISKEIKKVFRESAFILRDNVRKFEDKITRYLRVKYCIGLNSGTDALLMIMSQLNLKKKDEIIVPSHTYVASVSAIKHVGAEPVFVDIRDDYNIDPNCIESKITKRTKAIMVVHLNGRSCEMDKINKLAKRYKLYVIEDAAQSLGAKFKNKYVGNFGLASAFSLHPMKSLSVPGDGGFLTTNSKRIYNKIMLLRDHGRLNTKKGVKRICYGVNSRLDNLHAGIALIKLKYFKEWVKKRRLIAKYYTKNLIGLEKYGLLTPNFNNKKNFFFDTFNSYVIRVNNRSKFKRFMIKKGIEVFSHIDKGVHLEKNLYNKKIKLLITEKIEKQIISLPIYPELKKTKQKYIVNVIKEFFEKK